MDFASLRDQVSNLTLYDLKAGVRKVQNAVMNYTEMEAKVREATNNEPWGASTTVMQEIANGTYSYQLLNEIMPMIYKRFTEKAAEEWRQIYKALQLLEFLVKNGSERVIDDARSHLSLLKMLRQFHFIDNNGKDQGINVRNRAKELAELLSDVERIRAERKKARATRGKYGGVEGGGMGMSSGMSSGSRYGGFSSEDAAGYGAYSGGVYGDGGGFGGASAGDSGFSDTQRHRDRFEEYDEYDEGGSPAPSRSEPRAGRERSTREAAKKAEPPKPKEPEVDLFDFGDEPLTTTQPVAPATFQSPAAAADDDDFDDFQSAAPSTASIAPALTAQPPSSIAAPQPRSGAQAANLSDLFSTTSPVPSNSATGTSSGTFSPPAAGFGMQKPPSGYQAAQPNYFQSVSVASPAAGPAAALSSPPQQQGPSGIASKPKAPAAGGDPFSGLLGGAAKGKQTPSKGASMADMAKQKSSAAIWGASATSPPPAGAQGGQKIGGGLDDLLG